MNLEELREQVTTDDLPLQDNAQNLVYARGSNDASYMLIGEAPGKAEDEQGVPFVGRSGQELDSMLESHDIDDVYITNVVKYRPPDNRDPTVEEIKAHAPILRAQILLVDPDVIVTLGNVATRFVLAGCSTDGMQDVPGISSIHGSMQSIVLDGYEYRVIPTYHPAAMLYNPGLEDEFRSDIGKLKQSVLTSHN